MRGWEWSPETKCGVGFDFFYFFAGFYFCKTISSCVWDFFYAILSIPKKRVFCATFQQKRNIYDHLKQLKNTLTKKRVKTHFFLQGCYSRKACDRNNLEKKIVSVWLSLINFLTFAYMEGENPKTDCNRYGFGYFCLPFPLCFISSTIRKNWASLRKV